MASFLAARAMFDSHQPRKALVELDKVAALCEKVGYHRFLRPHAARAQELLEYALVRHLHEPVLRDIEPDRARARRAAAAEAEPQPGPEMLPNVQAFAFGRGAVLVGERQVSDLEWRSEKSKEMFFFLLAKGAVGKEAIFAALWPDLPDSKCNSNFHSSLYRLRRALFHECVVREADGAYALNPKGVFTSDVDAFERAMAAADSAKD